MLRLAKTLDSINEYVAIAVRWLVLAMVLVQFAIVVGRYVFGVNYIAAQESVLYLHATFFMLAAGYTLLVDKHVRVDVFYARVSAKTRDRIDVFGHVFFLMPTMVAVLYCPGLQLSTPGKYWKVPSLWVGSRRCFYSKR